jgi:two-component sensor histidine kinase
MARFSPGPMSIRVRLGVAMAIALLPVLLLGVAQSAIAFYKEGQERQTALIAAGERRVESARARLDGAIVVLQTVSPATVGVSCSPRLRELMTRMPGVINMVRLDRFGRVVCAADTVNAGRPRTQAPWFRKLAGGAVSAADAAQPGGYVSQPALLVATRATDAAGGFDGAIAAFYGLSSLTPRADPTGPKDTLITLVDGQGRYLSGAPPAAFPTVPKSWIDEAAAGGRPPIRHARDRAGQDRVYVVTHLPATDLNAVLSAPSPGLFSWARLNLLSSVIFPLIAFFATLAAVWVAADRIIVRWLHYVERIAAIYAKGRFSVRPLQADRAPPEIRELAETLDAMAETIVARDTSLHDSLAQKDALMREIHHRVKNNLQVITSLLSLQQRAMPDSSAREAISDTRQRITAMALIYRALYQGSDLRKVELRGFLEELIAQLIVSDHDAHGSIRTELHADEVIIHPDKLAPLALFAVEAISNAQKHAFTGRGGTLRVDFRVKGEEAELEIADDGPGGGQTRLATGVGRTLMGAFARQLHGRAEIGPNQWGGLTARLTFPTPDLRAATPEEPGARTRRNRAAA